MTDKREWYTAECWVRDKWTTFTANDGTLETAKTITAGWIHSGIKTRIVKHATEVIEEREARDA